jgi:hypothetical protein
MARHIKCGNLRDSFPRLFELTYLFCCKNCFCRPSSRPGGFDRNRIKHHEITQD